MPKGKLPQNLKDWVEARRRFRLSHAQVQMARELGMNPKKLGKLANHDQEPWKSPLPRFIEELYLKRFGRKRPEVVVSIEERSRTEDAKRAARKETRRQGAGSGNIETFHLREKAPTGLRAQVARTEASRLGGLLRALVSCCARSTTGDPSPRLRDGWKAPRSEHRRSSPPVGTMPAARRGVRRCSFDGVINSSSADTGAILWQRPGSPVPASSPVRPAVVRELLLRGPHPRSRG
ncbi:MAG: hypothetical protein ACRD6W_16375 [Nitrososphaerales archaeon]